MIGGAPPIGHAPSDVRASGGEEVRITSDTGGQKGSKPAAFDLIPTLPLTLLAIQYGKGAAKYEKVHGLDNWRNGYAWSLSYAAMQRHLTAFWGGEDIDEETGQPHLVAAAWHCFTLLEFMHTPDFQRFDDRQDKLGHRNNPRSSRRLLSRLGDILRLR